LFVIDVAGRHPPGSRDHIRVTFLVVKMRLGEIARIPFVDHAIEPGLAGIAEQRARLLPAFLAAPLDIFRQDGRNMGWIGRRAFGVANGGFGTLRMDDSRKNGGSDTCGDYSTPDHHSRETHTGSSLELRDPPT